MEYRFLNPGDEELIARSEKETANGIAVAVRTTGYDLDFHEVVEIAITDLDGTVLFSRRVKPQNATDWQASEATGGLGPADVEDAEELYQFEDEVAELFEQARVVVAQHLAFAQGAIESSWVSLPAFDGVDLVELFCQSHCTSDYPGKPATAAALPGIADYYGLPQVDGKMIAVVPEAQAEAALAAACYRAIVAEHASERQAKGADYWRRYDESKADERAEDERRQAAARLREHRFNQMNGLLWIAGALIFVSLAIQLYQRGGDIGVIIIAVAIAIFAASRGIVNFRK